MMHPILNHMQTYWDKPQRSSYQRDGLINLSSNVLLHPELANIQKHFLSQLSTFSDYASYDAIRSKLANYYDLPFWQVGFVAGSDYLISVLMQLAKDLMLSSIILAKPYYYNYVNYAHAFQLPIHFIRHHELFSEEVLQTCSDIKPAFIFLTSPCPLTGEVLDPMQLSIWIDEMSSYGHFIILDQAYAGFGSDLYLSLVKKHPTLFLFQSYSKSYGAAGLRFCHYFGPDLMVKRLKEYGIENTLSIYAIQYADYVHDHMPRFQQIRNDITRWREDNHHYLRNHVSTIKLNKSAANFISMNVKPNELDNFVNMAREKGIFLKKHINDDQAYLRITVVEPKVFSTLYSLFEKENFSC